ncbi:MAG: hypothetical protein IJN59_04075, partial [Oscillospiraceae bacterium]|nr:hypothetical protein [Oscillospiraceae bacterium]
MFFRNNNKNSIKTLLAVVAALVYIGIFAALCKQGMDPVIWGFVMGGCYILTVLLFAFVYKAIVSGSAAMSVEDEVTLTSYTRDLLVRLSQPVAICDDLGRLIWHNDRLSAMVDGQRHFGEFFAEVFNTDFNAVVDSGEDGTVCHAGGNSFAVNAYTTNIDSKRYYIMLCNDRTELDRALQRVDEEETQVAYVVIDNLAEILQFVRDKSRSASAEIETLLSGWADSVGGVLKEYERDKFIFLFHKCHLREFVEDKFSIVDKIREIRVGESNLPITISIGVSGVDGSLAEKEKTAHAALDMALQRGGDQAAVKYATEMLFFGGKTKTVQKRTKVRARVFASELIHHISAGDRVIIMGHARADMDSLGACLGIAKLAKFCGVRPFIVSDASDKNTAPFIEKLQ